MAEKRFSVLLLLLKASGIVKILSRICECLEYTRLDRTCHNRTYSELTAHDVHPSREMSLSGSTDSTVRKVVRLRSHTETKHLTWNILSRNAQLIPVVSARVSNMPDNRPKALLLSFRLPE